MIHSTPKRNLKNFSLARIERVMRLISCANKRLEYGGALKINKLSGGVRPRPHITPIRGAIASTPLVGD